GPRDHGSLHRTHHPTPRGGYLGPVAWRRLPPPIAATAALMSGVSLALPGASCGRSGFDLLAGADGGGDDDAGAPDGGLPVDCTSAMLVTTASDEDDPGESPGPPHLGSGLSLREAVRLANETPGRDCIAFDGPTSVNYLNELPPLSDPDGLVID